MLPQSGTGHKYKMPRRAECPRADDPRPRGVRTLVDGEDAYRIRVGDYRISYTVFDDVVLVVHVVRVRHRRAYRRSAFSGSEETSVG